MLEFLQSKQFHVVASFILGFGIVCLFRASCKGDDCVTHKAPHTDEITKATYQIGQKCYQFKTEITDCGSGGVIESFQDGA